MYCFPGGEIGKPGETLQDSSRGRGKFYKYLFREGCLSLRSLTRSPLRRWRDLQASTVACWRRSHEKIGSRSNSLVSSPLAKNLRGRLATRFVPGQYNPACSSGYISLRACPIWFSLHVCGGRIFYTAYITRLLRA